uniref:Uncharacterized protein n=1 Tax=Leersia perrieri TaxID=77586 RepID=A0A0D9XZ27_9ORYZ
MSKKQAILKSIWSPFTAVFRTKFSPATPSNLVVLKSSGEITGDSHDDAIVTKKSRSSLEDLLKIEASTNPPEENNSSSEESALQLVVSFPNNGSTIACCPPPPPAAAGGGGAVVVRPTMRTVRVNRLVVLVPAALRARSRAGKTMDAGMQTKRGGSYWRIGGRGGAGGERSELFYQRPIPLGRRCRVQHLEEGAYVM